MNYKVESNSIIDEKIVPRLYSIHKKIYGSKKIGKPFNEWKQDFYSTYHGTFKKSTLLFSSSANTQDIDGYLILTEPSLINNKYWSKILEGGISSSTNQRLNFVQMFTYLFQYGYSYNINFFSETGPSFKSLLNILYGLGFIHIDDIMESIELVNQFLGDVPFSFMHVENHLAIKRKTKISEDYTGYILGREYISNKNANYEITSEIQLEDSNEYAG